MDGQGYNEPSFYILQFLLPQTYKTIILNYTFIKRFWPKVTWRSFSVFESKSVLCVYKSIDLYLLSQVVELFLLGMNTEVNSLCFEITCKTKVKQRNKKWWTYLFIYYVFLFFPLRTSGLLVCGSLVVSLRWIKTLCLGKRRKDTS